MRCTSIRTVNGCDILWCDTVKYLGIYLTAASVFKCLYDYAKRSFYRAFNGTFVKVGRAASEEVVIQLLKAKCLPVLFYGLEACPINKEQSKSLDYAIHSCFRFFFLLKTSLLRRLYDLFRMPVCFRSSKEKNAKVPRKNSGVTESIVRVIY